MEIAQINRANLVKRFYAILFDYIIVFYPLRFIFIVVGMLFDSDPLGIAELVLGSFILLELIVVLIYFAVFAHRRNGQTVGKTINKIKVVDLEGNNPTLGRFILRESIARGIPFIGSFFFKELALLWLLTYLLALTDDRKALHDIIAKTQVISIDIPSRRGNGA